MKMVAERQGASLIASRRKRSLCSFGFYQPSRVFCARSPTQSNEDHVVIVDQTVVWSKQGRKGTREVMVVSE